MEQPRSYSFVVNVPVPNPISSTTAFSSSHYGLENEPEYLFITGKRVCVFLIRNANSFVITISPKVELYVV